jgi:dTDP-4-amino-4,6-dideoxygalactose transaminase
MFDTVVAFEQRVAHYFGAAQGVAVDCCTHALELCLRLQGTKITSVPAHTYLSVPMTMSKLGIIWDFADLAWQDHYHIGGTNIIDAATFWQPQGYIPGTYMCLSFQFKKHLNLGRGGMILTDHTDSATELRKMSYDGRDGTAAWATQDVRTLGYHYYMTPETAQQGMARFDDACARPPRQWSWEDYPNLRNMSVFDDRQQ